MEFHFIEISKLISDWKSNKLDPWDDALARWLLMLGMVDRRKGAVYGDIYKELEEIAMKDETLRSAFKNWEEISSTHEQVLAYETRLKRVLDEEAAQREAELRMEEVKREAVLRVEEAREKEKKAIARRLLAKGMDIEDVAEVTGLEKDKVVEKKVYPLVPPKTEYRLTSFGKTLIPLIIEMEKWGEMYNRRNAR